MADNPKRDRLEREINEILGKIERFPEPQARRKQARKRALRNFGDAVSARQRAFTRELSRISLSQVMLASFLLILASLFFPGLAKQWVLFAGIVLFISSFALMMFGGRKRSYGGSGQGYWRGRPVSYSGERWNDRVKRWLARRQRR